MDEKKISSKQNNDELSQEQTYKIDQTLFLVQPVFNENSRNTLGNALISLMRNEIESM